MSDQLLQHQNKYTTSKYGRRRLLSTVVSQHRALKQSESEAYTNISVAREMVALSASAACMPLPKRRGAAEVWEVAGVALT